MFEPFVFDARAYQGTLEDAKWGDQKIRMVVLDTVRTGDARDAHAKQSKKKYAQVFDRVEKEFAHGDQPLWILSHIPIYSLNGTNFKTTVMLDALNDSKLSKQLSKLKMTLAAHRHEALLINPGAGNPATNGPVQYAAGHGGVTLSGKSRTQLACDLAEVEWKPIGKKKEAAMSWAALRRPNWGYLKADFRDASTSFAMHFYSLKQDQWYGDATMNCASAENGAFLCPYLPQADPVKCP